MAERSDTDPAQADQAILPSNGLASEPVAADKAEQPAPVTGYAAAEDADDTAVDDPAADDTGVDEAAADDTGIDEAATGEAPAEAAAAGARDRVRRGRRRR